MQTKQLFYCIYRALDLQHSQLGNKIPPLYILNNFTSFHISVLILYQDVFKTFGWSGDYCHVYIKLLILGPGHIITKHTVFSWALISAGYCGYTEEQIYWATVSGECAKGKVRLSHCKRFHPTPHSAKRDQLGK